MIRRVSCFCYRNKSLRGTRGEERKGWRGDKTTCAVWIGLDEMFVKEEECWGEAAGESRLLKTGTSCMCLREYYYVNSRCSASCKVTWFVFTLPGTFLFTLLKLGLVHDSDPPFQKAGWLWLAVFGLETPLCILVCAVPVLVRSPYWFNKAQWPLCSYLGLLFEMMATFEWCLTRKGWPHMCGGHHVLFTITQCDYCDGKGAESAGVIIAT